LQWGHWVIIFRTPCACATSKATSVKVGQ
jgi:hypothetical protein